VPVQPGAIKAWRDIARHRRSERGVP
jgi:hypothetical protein